MDKQVMHSAHVLSNDELAPGVFRLSVRGSFDVEPAQFFMLRAWDLDPLLSRPMSVLDNTDDQISFLFRVRGRGTGLLGGLRPGDAISLLGPLGNGWKPLPGRLALIGGGCGISPLLHTAKAFKACDLYLGFKEEPFLRDAFAAIGNRVVVTSESGNGGRKDLISNVFDPSGYDACYACGPQAMLEALAWMCDSSSVPLFVSLEERMACGIGACLGCAVRTTAGIRRVCRDGPVFPAAEVIWDA